MTDRLEVLVARIVSGGQILSSCGEDLGLELHALGHGLDDQLGGGEVLQRRAEPDPLEDRVAVGRVELAAAHRAVGGLLDVPAAARDRLVVDLHGGDRQARPGEHLGDAGTHGAQPDDADLVQFSGHAAISSDRGDRRSLSSARAAAARGLPAGNPTAAPAATERAAGRHGDVADGHDRARRLGRRGGPGRPGGATALPLHALPVAARRPTREAAHGASWPGRQSAMRQKPRLRWKIIAILAIGALVLLGLAGTVAQGGAKARRSRWSARPPPSTRVRAARREPTSRSSPTARPRP